jgi:hypothetical protein
MHSTNSIDDDYLGSGRKLAKVKKRYGIKNFKKEILEFLPDRGSLKEREKQLVNEDILKDPLCMNLMQGGTGGWHPNIFGGREGHIKGGQSLQKRIKSDLKFQRKCKNASIKIAKKLWKEGKFKVKFGKENSFFKKHHTKETIKQMKISHKEKHFGILNSQYRTCWITNGKENRKVKKANLVLENGWYLGRICKMAQ